MHMPMQAPTEGDFPTPLSKFIVLLLEGLQPLFDLPDGGQGSAPGQPAGPGLIAQQGMGGCGFMQLTTKQTNNRQVQSVNVYDEAVLWDECCRVSPCLRVTHSGPKHRRAFKGCRCR
jgi:hypothetical protein